MIHHVFANKSNIGDWLSARGIQALLGNMPIVEHLCDEPFVPETLDALSALTPQDVIVIGGGGLFMDYFTPLWEGLRGIVDRVPCCIWGVGYCDLKRETSQPSHDVLVEVIKKCRVCVVRDELSRRLLSGCTAGPSVPCPSMNVVETIRDSGNGLLHVASSLAVGDEVYNAMVASGQRFAEQTNRAYRATSNYLDSPRSVADLDHTLRLYAKSDIVLSSRLHGCIIAIAMGRRVLAVSGDYKIDSFMKAAGLEEWVCNLDEIESVPERLASLHEQKVPNDFVQRCRTANRSVAAEVLAVCSESERST